MIVETMTELFSYICGQSRSFSVDGVLLPVDQRCLGLYVGTLLTAIWLAASGIWRCGLPTREIVWVNACVLLLAMLGGLHVIDPGPLWRFACGLWTGHVVLLWLSGSALQFWSRGRSRACLLRPWLPVQRTQAVAAPFALAGLAAMLPELLWLGWGFWTAAATLGVVSLATVGLSALAGSIWCGSLLRRST